MRPYRPVLAIVFLLTSCGSPRIDQSAVRVPTDPAPTAPTPPPPPAPKTAVFIGDSLVENWNLATWFPGMPYTNKGIGGNSDSDMLIRFDSDVIVAKPDIVVIWGSANHLSDNVPGAESDLASMYQKASDAGIRVIACTVAPHLGPNHAADIAVVSLNTWIRDYASAHSIPVADFYSVLVDPDNDNQLKAGLTVDGTHLNADGYAVITPLANSALADIDLRVQTQ